MNEFIGVAIEKKDLHRVFNIIDKDRSGMIMMDEVKQLASSTWKEAPTEENEDGWLEADEDLKGNDILIKEQIRDIYDDVKNKLETKNITFDQVVYNDLQYNPMMLINVRGLQTAMEKIGVILSSVHAERMIKELRRANNDKFECTYKDFIDFLTKRRINVAFLEKGPIDPLHASCAQALSGVKDLYNFSYETLFNVISGQKKSTGSVKKEDFVLCLQGMDLKLSVEDITGFFNFCDEQGLNRINKRQFIDNVNGVTSKLGGQSYLEQQLIKGAQTTKKGQTNTSYVLQVVKLICDGIQSRKLNIKQLSLSMDINGTGFVSRPEFVSVCQQLSDVATLE